MQGVIEKVTAFITRESGDGHDLLLFKHPNAGIQIPAGTVEDNETPEEAVLREVSEETGLTSLSVGQYLGCREDRLPEGQRILVESTKVYARPDVTSFDWAHLRKGILVTLSGRRIGGFSQVTYDELDRVPNPSYVTMRITGWVPDTVLVVTRRRHFFHLEFDGQSEERWTVYSDYHDFALFWAPLEALPKIIHPQDEWLEFLRKRFHSLALG
jgi:8-oxo-dGTP pyrophosphatase MutT (NUDIX family)